MIDDKSASETPSNNEKLSYKFILDGLRERQLKQFDRTLEMQLEVVVEAVSEMAAPVEEKIEVASEVTPEVHLEAEFCGTEAEAETEPPVDTESLESYDGIDLPRDKKYFRIGEVSDLIGVEPYVLRYWEGEFKLLKPEKSGSGHRVYGRKDVETLHRIKHLLYVEKFSIKGAKKKLLERRKEGAVATVSAGDLKKRHDFLKGMAHGLKDLLHFARDNNPGG